MLWDADTRVVRGGSVAVELVRMGVEDVRFLCGRPSADGRSQRWVWRREFEIWELSMLVLICLHALVGTFGKCLHARHSG
jgi:hypothetical protein